MNAKTKITNIRLEQWMDWCNFQSTEKQPLDFLMQYIRPVWIADHGAQWGFYPFSRGADVGEFASDRVTLKKAMEFAESLPVPVIIDLEKYWPRGDGWGNVGCGSATRPKLLTSGIFAGRATQMIDPVIAARTNKEVPIGAYLPGNFWDKAGQNFVDLFVNGFAKLFAPKLDFLLIDVYAHPDDGGASNYMERVRQNIRAYKNLGKPIAIIIKYSAEGAASDRIGYMKAAKRAGELENIKAIAFWDELTMPWSEEIGQAYKTIR